MYKRILVPLDGSKSAEAVLEYARQLAECTGAEVLLLHLVTYPHYDYLLTDPELSASLRQHLDSEAAKYLQRLVDQVSRSGLRVRAEVLSVSGSVADAILRHAREQQVDLIALTTHGHRGPDGWVQGSVADRVLRRAQAPVLVVRPGR